VERCSKANLNPQKIVSPVEEEEVEEEKKKKEKKKNKKGGSEKLEREM
jgi:hypothetical protein